MGSYKYSLQVKIDYKESEKTFFIKKYLDFNRLYFKKKDSHNGAILIDCFPIPDWIFVNSLFLNSLAKKQNLEIISYGLRYREKTTDELYKSFGCSKHLKIFLNAAMRKERFKKFLEITKNIEEKSDLFDLRIDGIWIGMDIYESILRSGVPTVPINSFRTSRIIYYALSYFVYFQHAFEFNHIKALALSHDNYIGMGLVARIAYSRGVPVYFANAYGVLKTDHTHQIYEIYKSYKNIFNKLNSSQKLDGIKWSKEMLARRINGEVGVEMSYQRKTAYHSDKISKQLQRGKKLKVIVATHCFYDSPHGFGGMIFIDFYEWLRYLGEFSAETDYEWYLKPHADYLPGTMEVLQEFIKKYPKFKIIDPMVSWHQLKEEGANVALTCYGSIGHELPLLGWKVVNAGYNPHIAYKFNWHAIDKTRYRKLLIELSNLGEVEGIDEIYEFFYVHKKLISENNFFFESAEEMIFSSSSDLDRLSAYNDFVDIAPKILNNASDRINAFIDSGGTSTNIFINSEFNSNRGK
jgi:hypothetical protein